MFGTDRDAIRQYYYDVWDKLQAHSALTPLEQQLAAVILEHPEYHSYLKPMARQTTAELLLKQDDTNPFMHMGLHLALRDQVSLDRPQGIQTLFQQLLKRHHDALAAEHILLPILADVLADALSSGQMPDELAYLERVHAVTGW